MTGSLPSLLRSLAEMPGSHELLSLPVDEGVTHFGSPGSNEPSMTMALPDSRQVVPHAR